MWWTAPYGIAMCQDEFVETYQGRPSMEQIIRIGIDTSKSVFQLHGVNTAEQPVLRRRLRRAGVLKFFARLPPTVVGLEACGGSHYWAREIGALGHEVRLVPTQYAKLYVKRNKNDPADAEAVCEAMGRPTMRFVPVKSAENQASLMLAKLRERVVRERTRLTNSIRGFAGEFGLVARQGLSQVEPLLGRIASDRDVPVLARELFEELGAEYREVGERLKRINRKLRTRQRGDARVKRLKAIPGVGEVGAALLSWKAPEAELFGSGRDFAAWAGLTPRDHSSANRRRLGAITRAGDETLRAVLVCGAMSIVSKVRSGRLEGSPWLEALVRRKSPKEAAVALANKLARIAWKLMVGGEDYDPRRADAILAPAA